MCEHGAHGHKVNTAFLDVSSEQITPRRSSVRDCMGLSSIVYTYGCTGLAAVLTLHTKQYRIHTTSTNKMLSHIEEEERTHQDCNLLVCIQLQLACIMSAKLAVDHLHIHCVCLPIADGLLYGKSGIQNAAGSSLALLTTFTSLTLGYAALLCSLRCLQSQQADSQWVGKLLME